MSPEDRARRAGEVMWAADEASKWLGMSLDHVGPGTATLSFTVAPHHANGHGICHGGYIFTLADSAFAFACNSYNRLAVAQHNQITFLKPGMVGARLVAVATETARTGRTGVYDAEVRDGETLIAIFRGASREIGGTHFDEEEESA